MKTSAERQAEEQALFDMVLTRASEQLVLSYGRLNGRGERNLPSFLLARAKPYDEEPAVTVRPVPAAVRASEAWPAVTPDAARHVRLGPSAIETFLQCPFQFFAQRTLRLKDPPCDPWERLDPRAQGELGHRVLELHFRDGVPVETAFAEVFEQARLDKKLPEGYRTEAIRLELLHGIQLLAADWRMRRNGTESHFEREFSFELTEGTLISGRIDRLEVDHLKRAVVFDYKYRRRNGIRASVSANEDGTKVQGGLYLMGAKALGYEPAGMVYCGFKREVSVAGWVVTPLYPDLKSACSPSHIEEVMQKSRDVSLQAVADIRDGRIVPHPADTTRCEWCSFAAMCRVEAVPATRVAGGSNGA
jgi:ATP-dependent helicase/DNAse subunit B